MKKILVTAALPYANGPLHLGHIRSTYLPADIFSRFQRLRGNDCVYICATDEHGTPIVAGAQKEGKTPQQFVDFYHEKDRHEFAALGFSFDIFYRTNSPENEERTQFFYNKLKEKGHVYSQDVQQAYCEFDKRFLPDRFVVGTCPHCGAKDIYSDYCEMCGRSLSAGEIKDPKCITCKRSPTSRTTKHQFLKLSAFSKTLDGWLGNNKNLQAEVVNYVRNWIKEGLRDWDISRDMEWGVPVPDVPGQVFYVWFDAPIGYMASTEAWAKKAGKKWEDYWNSTTYHFIGKDIIYHHFLFWPAMLNGAGFRFPDFIPTRGYLNLEGRKFSKSKNWFVSLEDYLKEFPADYLRFYQTLVTGYDVQDADFVWKDFQAKVNNGLIASFGNFVHRTLVLVRKKCEGKIPQPVLGDEEKKLLKRMDEVAQKSAEQIEAIELRAGLETIMGLSDELNRFLSEREPWKEKDQAKVDATLYVCSRGVTTLAILLSPYLPFTSEKIFGLLKLDKKNLKWENASKELLKSGVLIDEPAPLFEKVSDEKIAKMEEKLKGQPQRS